MSGTNPPSYRSDEPTCYNCGGQGHWAIACPEPTRAVPAGLEAHRNAAQSKFPVHASQYANPNYHQGQNLDHRDQRGGPRRQKGPIITKYGNPPGMPPGQTPAPGQDYRQASYNNSHPPQNPGYPPSHLYPGLPPAPYHVPPPASYNYPHQQPHPQPPPPPPPHPPASTYYQAQGAYPPHQHPPPQPQYPAAPPPYHQPYDSRRQAPPPPPAGHPHAPGYQQSPPRGPPPTPSQYHQSPVDQHHPGPYRPYQDRPYEAHDYRHPQSRSQSRDYGYRSPGGYERSPSRGYERYDRPISRHSDPRRQSEGHSRPPYPGPPRSSSPRSRYDQHQRQQRSNSFTNKPNHHHQQEHKIHGHQPHSKPRSVSDHLPAPGPLLHALPQKPPDITKPATSPQQGQPGSRSQKKKERRKQAKSRAKERKKLAKAEGLQNRDGGSKEKDVVEPKDIPTGEPHPEADLKSPESVDDDDHMSDDELQEHDQPTGEASPDVSRAVPLPSEAGSTGAAGDQADMTSEVMTSTPVPQSAIYEPPVTIDTSPTATENDVKTEPSGPHVGSVASEESAINKLEEVESLPLMNDSRDIKQEPCVGGTDGRESLPADTKSKSSKQDIYQEEDPEKSRSEHDPNRHGKVQPQPQPQPNHQRNRRSSDRRSRSPVRHRRRDRSRSRSRSRGRARSRSGSRGRSRSRASSASSLNSIEMDLLGMDPDEHKRNSQSRDGNSRSPRIPRKKPPNSAYSRRW